MAANTLFFVDSTQCSSKFCVGLSLELDRENSHHIVNVLRLAVGQELELAHTTYTQAAIGRIVSLNKKRVQLCIETLVPFRSGYGCVSYVFMALCKAKKNDFIAEKATELGAQTLVFFRSQHSEFRFHSASDKEKKQERWTSIIRSAARQSMRHSIPHILIFDSLEEALKATESQRPKSAFTLSLETTAQSLYEFSPLTEHVALAVGPEGDFSSTEYALLAQQEFTPVRLGPTILRAETAVVAGMGALTAIAPDNY